MMVDTPSPNPEPPQPVEKKNPEKPNLKGILEIFGLIPILLAVFVTNDVGFTIVMIAFSGIVIGLFIWQWPNIAAKRRVLSLVFFLPLVLAVVLFRNLILWPQSEINFLTNPQPSGCFLGFSIKPAAVNFVVTDNLINYRYEFSGDQTNYGLSKTALQMEIIPKYYADNRYGRVVLRISGKDGRHVDQLLWDDFTKESPAKLVEIPLDDLIYVSGIELNSAALQTDLSSDEPLFNRAGVTLKVIREAEPDRVLGCTRTITLQNTPWAQYSKISYREGARYLDYFVRNLGDDGEFGYRVNLALIDRVVTDAQNPVWSGTVELPSGLNSQTFTLKKGEQYSASLAIPPGLARGRYVIQIYTYKKLDYIQLENAAPIETFGNAWLFANASQQHIFVVCNDPGKNCPQSAAYPIEQAGLTAFAVTEGNKAVDAILSTDSFLSNGQAANRYHLEYWPGPDQPDWVGLFLQYDDEGLDVSAYKTLRMTVRFLDVQPPLALNIFSGQQTSSVPIGSGKYGVMDTEEQTIEIPLSAFPEVDFSQLTLMTFTSDLTLLSDELDHEFEIGAIEFVGLK